MELSCQGNFKETHFIQARKSHVNKFVDMRFSQVIPCEKKNKTEAALWLAIFLFAHLFINYVNPELILFTKYIFIDIHWHFTLISSISQYVIWIVNMCAKRGRMDIQLMFADCLPTNEKLLIFLASGCRYSCKLKALTSRPLEKKKNRLQNILTRT